MALICMFCETLGSQKIRYLGFRATAVPGTDSTAMSDGKPAHEPGAAMASPLN